VFRDGNWQGLRPSLPETGERVEVPFFLGVPSGSGEAEIRNGDEKVAANASWDGDTLALQLINAYSSRIEATRTVEGGLEGTWYLKNPFWGNFEIPFVAHSIAAPTPVDRFGEGPAQKPPQVDFTGTWRGSWAILGPGVAKFEQHDNGVITGFLQNRHFGDSQHLAGVVSGRTAMLSTFDGTNQAANVTLTIEEEGVAVGRELSAGVWRDDIELTRDEEVELANEVRLREGSSLDLPVLEKYEGKPTILLLFATWCTACMDETRVLVDLYEKYRDRGLRIVAKAYDSTPDESQAQEAIGKYRELFDVEWPIHPVLGTTDDFGSQPPFPDLVGFEALPTTIFIRPNGEVHAIHGGFSGPATGEKHAQLVRDFEKHIQAILEPSAGPSP
jgi:thiol-disulfide isomerase/thioredoxin